MTIRHPRVRSSSPGIQAQTSALPPAPSTHGGALALVVRSVPGVYASEVADLRPGPARG